MKYHFYSLALLFTSSLTYAQDPSDSKTSSVRFAIGPSFHGTGDLKGVIVEAAYVFPLAKRFDLAAGISSTIHQVNDLDASTGYEQNSLHHVTAGIQFNPVVEYKVLALKPHSLRILAGGLLRYQSTSYPEMYSMAPPTQTNPYPTYSIISFGKQNTFTAGYLIGASYMVDLGQKWETGIRAAFQNDTNGDVITQLALIVGRKVQ